VRPASGNSILDRSGIFHTKSIIPRPVDARIPVTARQKTGVELVFIFAVSVFVVGYAYIFYPLILFLWASLKPDPTIRQDAPTPLSVVIAVRDGEEHVAARLANFFEQDYPGELIEVILVSDGSRDGTVAAARDFGDPRVRVVKLDEPAGKAVALNAGLGHASNDIVVFADVRQRFTRNAFADLAAAFADRRVGAVSGELVITQDAESEVGEGVGLYWSYEKLIRRKESEIDSVVGATGSIYAIRRELYVPLEANALLDDFLVPMRIVLGGHRVIFERSARAYDRVTTKASQEFNRKVRTLAGNFQAFRLEKRLFDPTKNRVFFQMASHKIARLAVPYFLIAAFVSNWYLDAPHYRFALACQIVFYLSPLLRITPLGDTRIGALSRVAWTFIVLNAAAVAGLWVFLTGKDKEIWKATRR
jgi:cellulose synthase/poly-beta-1,6-N-acetylglucosamine synthase-like glycosyltransferase